MRSMMQRPINTLRGSALALCAALSLTSCSEPEQDDFKSEGGISPDPTGIVSGSVLYVGPRPQCDYKGSRPGRVRGRVVLTMFLYDNPPPPEGRATSALNLKFLNPEELFALSDCLPEGQVADPSDPELEIITRSIPYYWSQIALGTTHAVEYQIRGFYDTDEDMNPFFSVRNLPTEGDIAGAALNDPQDVSKGLLRIVMPRAKDAPNGYRQQGAMVALGSYVWLERPAFKLNRYRFMEASRTLQVRLIPGSSQIDVDATLHDMWANTCGGMPNCGLTLDQVTADEFQDTFDHVGVELDYDPDVYAFVSEPVDVLTVKQDAVDIPKADGQVDPHPLLGANLGLPWFTPIMVMTRSAPTSEMQAIETRAGVPNVRMIGSVLLENPVTPEVGPQPAKRTRLGSIEVAMPPVAAVELSVDNPLCRVPYLAPNNYTRAYESRLTYCSDLPTGVFSVSAIQGVIGGTRNAASTSVSDTGYVYDGGGLSGQAWTVPNDLGNPAQVGEGGALASQAAVTAFVVYDRDLDTQADCRTAQDPGNNLMVRPVNYRGICQPGEPVRIENPEGAVGAGIDGMGCLPSACCDGIQHLCGVPLCNVCTDETCPGLDLGDHPIRQGPTSIIGTSDEGKSIPNCLPFPLPAFCCPGAE